LIAIFAGLSGALVLLALLLVSVFREPFVAVCILVAAFAAGYESVWLWIVKRRRG
jgi:hypothetical protein